MIQNKTLVHCTLLILQHTLLHIYKNNKPFFHQVDLHTFTRHSTHRTFPMAINFLWLRQVHMITLNQTHPTDMPFQKNTPTLNPLLNSMIWTLLRSKAHTLWLTLQNQHTNKAFKKKHPTSFNAFTPWHTQPFIVHVTLPLLLHCITSSTCQPFSNAHSKLKSLTQQLNLLNLI